MNKLKALPVGYEDFSEIRTEDFYYVDKTKLIEQIFEYRSKVSLFTRPRRFGKSLNMSMLKYFFEIDTDKTLFDGLYISNNKELCDKYLGKYPVISITLKGIEGLTYKEAAFGVVELIKSEFRRHDFLLMDNKLNDEDKNTYREITSINEIDSIENVAKIRLSLKTLSYLLYKYYGKKTIILIDEYDVPLDKAFQNGYYKEMVSLIRGMFGETLKTNEYLEFAVLTGCLRISKESIFTGLNNFKVLSITDSKFDEEFGFTKEEVEQLLQYYGLEDKYSEVKEWYDGYRFGNAEIYCPWDVINYVDDARFDYDLEPENYWSNSSSNDLVKRFIDKADKNTKEEIEKLINGESINKNLRLDLTYDEIDNGIDNIWSVLFTTGYLTLADKPKEGIYKLRIPNKEVRDIFKSKINEWFKSLLNKDVLFPLWNSFNNGNSKIIEDTLNNILSNTISVFDPKGNEKETYYHALLSGLLVGNQDFNVYSNKESGIGFTDIMLESKVSNKGIVIEVKSVDKITDLDDSCLKALKQIKDKRYYEYLLNENKKDILLYGISFYKKTCRVRCEKLDNK